MATPHLSRQTIDSWAVDRAGLPHRACNGLARVHVHTIGELRRMSDQELLALRSLGRTSLRKIREFFEMTARIQRGRMTIRSVRDLLRRFLDPSMLFVIEHRYALPLAERGEPMTLQAIGELIGRTRERIRQIEEAAWERMRSEICMAFAREFAAFFAGWLDARGGICDSVEIEQLHRAEETAGYRPMSVLRLFVPWTGRISCRETYACSLPESELAAVEDAVLCELQKPMPPRRVEEILDRLEPSLAGLPDSVDRLKLVGCILRGHREISGTLDGRFFIPAQSAHWIIASILRDAGRPMHYREIAVEYNRRMDLRSQKTPGFILGILNRREGFSRVERATYRTSALSP